MKKKQKTNNNINPTQPNPQPQTTTHFGSYGAPPRVACGEKEVMGVLGSATRQTQERILHQQSTPAYGSE